MGSIGSQWFIKIACFSYKSDLSPIKWFLLAVCWCHFYSIPTNPSLVSLLLHIVCVAPHACKGWSNYHSNTCPGLIWRGLKLWSHMLLHLLSSSMIACISFWCAPLAPACSQHKYDDKAHQWIVINKHPFNKKHPKYSVLSIQWIFGEVG